MTEDPELIDKVKRGDERSCRTLYDGHVDALYRFLCQYSRDRVQVEEWVQRAFIKAFRNIQGFHEDARFSTWLFTIGLNEMRSDMRKPSLVMFKSDDAHEHVGTTPEDDTFVWDGMMKQWLDELEESKRTVFILYEVEGYSHAEIAAMLNVGVSTSRTLLHRAKIYLKQKWDAEEKSA